MNLTKREREMVVATKQGYNDYPYGGMPVEYKEEGQKHMAEAWKGGWSKAKQENIDYSSDFY